MKALLSVSAVVHKSSALTIHIEEAYRSYLFNFCSQQLPIHVVFCKPVVAAVQRWENADVVNFMGWSSCCGQLWGSLCTLAEGEDSG